MTETMPLRLVAVGDIMLGRGVKTTPVKNAVQLLDPDILKKLNGDVVTGNLECVMGYKGTPNPASHSHFQGDPDFGRSIVERLNVVTLANNHIGDFGDIAIEETLAWLAQIDVAHVGIGRTADDASCPVTFDIRGHKVAIFGATTVGNMAAGSRYVLASPGPLLYRRAAEFVNSGYTCVLHLHTGGGDVCHPSPATRTLMNEVLDAGFSIVFGHHPHVLQGFQIAPGRIVFYSMGDFLFDKLEDGRDQALVVSASLNRAGSVNPIEIDIVQRSSDLRLSLMTGEAYSSVQKALVDLSTMIANGSSDEAYLKWRGSKVIALLRSVRRDYQAGGWRALKAKLSRVNTRKLNELVLKR